jgi:diadenosine tetraphosphate (Ap4A) HIT family hydrolase
MQCFAQLLQAFRPAAVELLPRHPHGCPFCAIGDEGRQLLYADERVVAFEDRAPAAAVHLLVCPREHVGSVGTLKASDGPLLLHMHTVGVKLLLGAAPSAEHKLGYHASGFHSVEHLHLHCFALPHEPAWKAMKYAPGWLWWESSAAAVQRLSADAKARAVLLESGTARATERDNAHVDRI